MTDIPDPPVGPSSRSPFVWPGLAVLLVVLIALGWWATRLTRAPELAVAPAAVTPTTPPSLAETTGEEGHLKIEVASLDRVSDGTVELRLAITNIAAIGTPALDISQRFSSDGPDRGTLAEVYLADLSHQRKVFVLRDAANAPLGSREAAPLGAGERRVVWARFPAPPAEATEIVVHVPHAEPMPNVPIGSGVGSRESGT